MLQQPLLAIKERSHTPKIKSNRLDFIRYTFAALADNACINETCKKIIMGHTLGNKEGTAFKTEEIADVTRAVYTEKTIPELVAEVNKLPVTFL